MYTAMQPRVPEKRTACPPEQSDEGSWRIDAQKFVKHGVSNNISNKNVQSHQ